MTSSPLRTVAAIAANSASVAPLVTVTSVPAFTRQPYMRSAFSAICSRNLGIPVIGAY